eukprot:TRINITY_DN1390_c0_g1_i1.p1 TRINITY_DN1390_c0_g1~~TRINITY_DN1390_c0_g1_i1.p1  ORF type:complete len:238 (-),score=7.92 TRINITY_DN1390_c0_g1_i1:391-1104(-)
MCSLERHGRVFLLKLLAEGEHRFTPAFCANILEALRTVESTEDARALVTTNEGKYYSNGLDLEWMKQDPDSRFPSLVTKFEEVMHALMRLSVPTVAALCGHAAAGGFLFAMAHDYRFMRRDRGLLYNSAVDINVVIPQGCLSLLRSKLSPQTFRDAVLKGLKSTSEQGHSSGLIDGLFDDPEQTIRGAMAEAEVLAEKPWNSASYRALRLSMYSDAVRMIETDIENGLHVEDMLKDV